MSDIRAENVAVKIMGREYVFACAPDERDSLLECVALVDQKMSAIKAMGKLSAVDRIAVMAALTIASEFVARRDAKSGSADAPGHESTKLESTKQLQDDLAIAGTPRRIKMLSEDIRRFIDDAGPRVSSESRNLFPK